MDSKRKKQAIAVLGSTGSIGTQALDVIAEHSDKLEAYVLVANNSADLLIEQAKKFQPDSVVIGNEAKYSYVSEALKQYDIKVYAGMDAVCQIVAMEEVDTVLTAMVGYAGLRPTVEAVKAGKRIALANKETLVVAGALIEKLSQQYKSPIIPVDSEHSAIFQCLTGEVNNAVHRIILTASGGPFRNFSLAELEKVTPAMACNHPNWDMGAKISVDSASMMNKGLEVIEARWLFGLHADQIEVLVHPQSIIHSMVEFADASTKAQLGVPSMKVPIAYAFSYPGRYEDIAPRLEWTKLSQLTFEQVDGSRFRCLDLAYEALRQGGNIPCILNAANEVAVDAFLQDKIPFLRMPDLIEDVVQQSTFACDLRYEDYVTSDEEARRLSREWINKHIQ